ncbi:hypothetical protein MIND_00444900 [Mycena indigotica]|uniref:Uncharacterized protein n=1 Tax=Mycena indigotica TaxID=2126181 RepID=A0A8H6SXL6_9AGAR|nr:uncharacterized protein MIND_00444900 [Mycena indigotica]KAF7306536.1 hypothetical protein MIND_00444900 [Mycena indigotica]
MATSFVFPQHSTTTTATRKPRPPPLVFPAKLASPTIDSRAVSPDFDSRSISSISSSPVSSASSEGSPTSVVGFASHRLSHHSRTPSTLVGFGRKQHFHRHSIAAQSPPSVDFSRKHDNRRSVSAPISRHSRSLSLAADYETASSNILGSSVPKSGIRRGTKPLLLPQQVKAKNRQSFTSRAKRTLILRIVALATAAPIEFVLNRLAIRTTPRRVLTDDEDEEKALLEPDSQADTNSDERESHEYQLKRVWFLYRFLRALAKV